MAAPENQCERMQDLLSLFVDGRLSPADVARVEAHVARCTGCASYLGFLRATNFAITKRPVVHAPADLSARIAQMTYAHPVPPTWSQRLSRLLAPAPTRWALGTTLAAAGIVGVAVLSHGTNKPSINGQMPAPVAVASPRATKAKNQIASSRPTVAHPAAKPPAIKVPAASASAAVATVAAHDVAPVVIASKSVTAPRRAETREQVRKVEAPEIAATLPVSKNHVSVFVPGPSKTAAHPAIDTSRLASLKAAPIISVVTPAHDPVRDSVLASMREGDHLRIASRGMKINERRATPALASEGHGSVAEPATHLETPAESPRNSLAPSSPATSASVLTRVAEAPRRHTLLGYNEGNTPADILGGIKTNVHSSVNSTGLPVEHAYISVCGDKDDSGKGAIQKESQSLQN